MQMLSMPTTNDEIRATQAITILKRRRSILYPILVLIIIKVNQFCFDIALENQFSIISQLRSLLGV